MSISIHSEYQARINRMNRKSFFDGLICLLLQQVTGVAPIVSMEVIDNDLVWFSRCRRRLHGGFPASARPILTGRTLPRATAEKEEGCYQHKAQRDVSCSHGFFLYL